MTWWIISYLVLYAVLAVAGVWEDYRDHRPAWFLNVAALSNLTTIYLFVALLAPRPPCPFGACCASGLRWRDVLGTIPGCRRYSRTGFRPRTLRETATRYGCYHCGSSVRPLCAGVCGCRDECIQIMSEGCPTNRMQ